MTAVEQAVEKVKHLSERDAVDLLGWLESRENPIDRRARLNREIDLGLEQTSRGEKFDGSAVHQEIRQLSRERRASANG